jgi:hypothetical protein
MAIAEVSAEASPPSQNPPFKGISPARSLL